MDNFIFKKHTALTQYESNICIEYFEGDKNIKEDKKRGYSLVYGSLGFDKFQFLKNILITNINEYVQQHLFLSTLYAPWGIDDSFNIQKYLPGNAYGGEHMEHGKDFCDARRLLAWMIYLNDVKDKGGTCWPQQNFTSIPQTGDLYIWPAGWTHSHYGIASPTEIKYIITGWCSFV